MPCIFPDATSVPSAPTPEPYPNLPTRSLTPKVKGLVAGVTVESGQSVVAIVGEGMAFRPGTAASRRGTLWHSKSTLTSSD